MKDGSFVNVSSTGVHIFTSYMHSAMGGAMLENQLLRV